MGGRRALLKQATSALALCAAMTMAQTHPATAASDIESGSTYIASNLGNGVNPDFKGGTLKIDTVNTISQDFTVEDYSTNTIDVNGNSVTMSGAFTGVGGLTIADNSGNGGGITLTSASNSLTGTITVDSGTSLAVADTGTLASVTDIIDNGTFDISGTSGGSTIVTLSGSGNVVLGSRNLTLSAAAGALSGAISGTGGLILTSGSQTLSGENTYTGGTTITAGTLTIGGGGNTGSIAGNVVDNGFLAFNRVDDITFSGIVTGSGGVTQLGSGTLTLTATQGYTGATTVTAGTLTLTANGTIATSSGVTANGIFDISAAGATIKSLAGTGTVNLGNQTLTLTAAAGTFAGTITGGGNIVINGGTQILSGVNGWSGTTTINAGTLQIGSGTIAFNIVNNGTFGFNSSGAIAMTGVVSGPGGLTQQGQGTTTISAAQAYTGTTTIANGTLALSGAGSIAPSSGVAITSGTFDISATTAGASVASLSGTGAVQLGTQNLTITGASGGFSGIIAGTGGLILTSGNQTLSGANTYTGITTIAGGTLLVAGTSSLASSSNVVDDAGLDISGVSSVAGSVSASLQSLSGTGQVVLGNKTLVLTNATGSFSGIISGTGNVTVSGGFQTLSGVNSYTGTTTVSGGTLALAGNGSIAASSNVVVNGTLDISNAAGPVTLATLAGSGSVNLGGRTLNLAGATGTFSGTILGSGGLALSGRAATLSGTNTYTGGTFINAGTLQIGNGSTSGAIVGDVVDNGTLAFNRSDTYVFAGAISGLGNLAQTGAGTTVLTGASTYSGNTTIAAGTLQIGNGGTDGAIAGDVVDNGVLAFNRSDALAFNGAISGTGSVSLVNGALTLAGVSSYTGATSVSSGATLRLGGSGSIAASGSVAVDGTLDASAATAGFSLVSLAGAGTVALGGQNLTLTGAKDTFSGAITGTGGLVLTGGTQTLSGISSYSGATVVKGGTLSVTGSAGAAGVTVAGGGTLSGTGTVGAISVASGGTLTPGVGGSGALTSTGNLSLAAGSIYNVDVSSSGAGSLATTGSAALDGTLVVTSTGGAYPLGQKFTVLTADGGIAGTFSATQVPSTGATFNTAVSYDADNVYLEVDLAKLSPLLPDGAAVNATSAVGGIDSAIAAGDSLTSAFNGLANQSSEGLGEAAAQLPGEIGAAAAGASQALFDPFLGAIFDHLASNIGNGGAAARPLALYARQAWATVFAASDRADGNTLDGSHDLTGSSAGFSGGADWAVSQHLSLGFALSGGTGNFRLADDFGTGRARAYQAAGYGLVQYSPRLYGAFAVIAAMDNISSQRTITVSGSDTLEGKANAFTLGGRYETGLRLDWATPYVAVQDMLIEMPAYTEQATAGSAGFALAYAAQGHNQASLEFGLRQNFDLPLSHRWGIRLTDRLALLETVSGSTPSTDAAFADLPDSTFNVLAARTGGGAALLGLGLGVHDQQGLSFDLRFNGRFTSTAKDYSGTAGVSFTW